jgi:hypothetical protein
MGVLPGWNCYSVRYSCAVLPLSRSVRAGLARHKFAGPLVHRLNILSCRVPPFPRQLAKGPSLGFWSHIEDRPRLRLRSPPPLFRGTTSLRQTQFAKTKKQKRKTQQKVFFFRPDASFLQCTLRNPPEPRGPEHPKPMATRTMTLIGFMAKLLQTRGRAAHRPDRDRPAIRLSACQTIFNAIGKLLAHRCQVEPFLFTDGVVGVFGKLPILRRLLSKVIIPIHVCHCAEDLP